MSRRAPPSSASLGREQRHQASVAIRKKGRDSRVAAERTAGNNPSELPLSPEELQQLRRFGVPQLVEDMRNGTTSILRATMATRKLLSMEREADGLADKMIALGLVGDMCAALDRSDSPRLQFEALWGLTNAAVLRPDVVVKTGAIPKIVRLLDAQNIPLREQSLWSLGNIMSKSSAYRNQCLALGALQRIRLLLHSVHGMTKEQHEMSARANDQEDSLRSVMSGVTAIPISRSNFIRQATWAMSNAIRGGDVDDDALREVSLALPVLRDIILREEDPNIVANALWTLADFSDRRPRLVLELGVCDRILELGLHSHGTVQAASAQAISNMCSGDPQALRALMLVRRGDLILAAHLRSERTELWVTASWTLSFACSELQTVCDRLLRYCDLFLERLMDHRVPSEARQDCAAIVSECFLTEEGAEILKFSDKPVLALVRTLQDTGLERDIDLAGKVVQCVINLLRRGGPGLARQFEEHGGMDCLRRIERSQLQSSYQQSTPLSIALEHMDSLYSEVDETYDPVFVMSGATSSSSSMTGAMWSLGEGEPSSPQRQQSLTRPVQDKHKGVERTTFQASMKD